MGWLWSSSSSKEDKTTAPVENTPPTTSTTTSSTSTLTTTPSSNSDSNTDPELQKFLDLLETEKNKPTPTQDEQQSSSPLSWLSLKKSPRSTAPKPSDIPPRDPLAEALLPTDMSCRQAFDQAWSCNSMGGQFTAVYRYGEMRSCSEHWDDFWFCMRTNGYSAEQRERAIRDHYRAKEFTKYGPGKPSSEDVWESRGEKVPEGTFFTQSIDD
ncbi:early meiotic induction 1 [Fusarium longipes]|uniref:Early meiotic induction 1 n=1 Tax=Fusarium longipes TaxID=694270 RepID=A0A395SXW5_9HYPO|nr:early meiotic induction 1 [Fusarium longipes]